MEAQHLHLKVDDAALDLIAKAGFDPVYGARPLKRAIQSEIETRWQKHCLKVNMHLIAQSMLKKRVVSSCLHKIKQCSMLL